MFGRLKRVLGVAGLVVLAASPTTAARSEMLKGSDFIDVMKDNTLSGQTAKGVPFNLYFLPSGFVTYEEEGGQLDRGRWRVSDKDQVCIKWQNWRGDREHCYVVTLEGRTVTWKGPAGSGTGYLRGFVATTFLNKRK